MNFFIIILDIFFFGVIIYQLFWLVSSFPAGYRSGFAPINNSLAVLIPAHNEERVIYSTVKRCIDGGVRFVFVVADSCTDNTVSEAKRAGAIVYQVSFSGKQLSLPWLTSLVLRRYSFIRKFVFLDADTYVDNDYFIKISYNLDYYSVVQSCLDVKNTKGIVAGWYALNYDFLNLFVMRGRSFWGRGALTGGTGWACRRQVLLDVPFEVSSLTDDLEYSVKLRLAGYKIRFLPDVPVYDEKPTNFWAGNIQRTRWVRGTTDVMFRYGFRLFLKDFDVFYLSAWTVLGLLNVPLVIYAVAVSPVYFIVYNYFYLLLFVIPVIYFHHKVNFFVWLLFPFMNLLNFFIIVYGTLTYRNKKWVRTAHKFNTNGGV